MTFIQLFNKQPDPKPWIVLVYCLGDTHNSTDHYERYDPESAEGAWERYKVVTSWDKCYTASLCFEVVGTDGGIVNDMFDLDSVGTALSVEGIGYPINKDGTADLECGTHLDDTCEEWFTSLSLEDRKIVEKVQANLKYLKG